MKMRHIVALLQEGYTTIQVQFQPGQRFYTYKGDLADNIQPGDYVVVDTPSDGYKIVRVHNVDAVPQIDVDADFSYKWIVQKVDPSKYLARVEAERAFADQLREIERIRQREQLIQDFHEKLPEGSAARAAFEAAVQRLGAPAAAQGQP